MPIIDINPTPLTQQQLLQQQARNLKQQINGQYQQIARVFHSAAAFVWANPALTPQQAFDLFGTDAADLLRVSAAYVALVTTYTGIAPQVVPAGYTVSPNLDGTVTVTHT